MSRKLAFEIKNPAEAYWRFRSDRANGVVSDRGITEVQLAKSRESTDTFQAVTSFLQSSFPAPSRNTNREDMLQRLQTCISAICVLRHSGCTANTIALLDVGRWRSGLSFAEQAADVVEALVSTTKRGEYGVHNAYFPASAAHGKIGKALVAQEFGRSWQFSRSHTVSRGPTRSHKVYKVSKGLTRFHKVSQGPLSRTRTSGTKAVGQVRWYIYIYIYIYISREGVRKCVPSPLI